MQYWAWLSSMTGVSAAAKAALLAYFGDAESIYRASEEALKTAVPDLKKTELSELAFHEFDRAREILHQCERQHLQLVTINDSAYPRRLRNIYAPPAVLYVEGRLPELDEEAAVTVAGTRKASPYGLKMARELGWQISSCGGLVVSGLTRGIDETAAYGALLSGRCVGVLGVAHEKERSSLARDVAARGCLISEYPPGSPNYRSFFRDRNRITAGLSVALVIVEAPEGSGALLLARDAIEQGRDVYAVPGNVDAPNSAGILTLLQNGAKPVRSGWDVLCEYERRFPGRLQEKTAAAPAAATVQKPAPAAPAVTVTEEKSVDKTDSAGYIDLREQLSGLSEDQLKILTAIEEGGSHVDDIIEATQLGTARVLSQLTVLQIKGFVRAEAGRRVVLNIKAKK